MRPLFLAWLVAGTIGCSVDVGNLFGNDGSGGSGTGGAGSQQATTTDGATSTSDGSTTSTTTTSTSTTGATTATTGATTATTGSGMTDPTVFCDGSEWTEISCNTADDCNGGVCCGTYDQGWIQVECAQQCNGGNDLVMCFGDPGACMPGETCTPSQALGDGYAFCGN